MCKVYQISIRDNMEGATRTFLISSEQVKSRFSAIKYTLNKLELNNAIVTDVLDDTDEKMVAVINNGQYEAVVMKMMDGFVEITPEPKPANEPHVIDPTKQEPEVQPSIVPMKEPPTFENTSTIEHPAGDRIDAFMSKLPPSISSPVRDIVRNTLHHVALYPETLGQDHWQFGDSIFIIPFWDSTETTNGSFQLAAFDNKVSIRVLSGDKEVYSVNIISIDLENRMFRVENENTAEGSVFTNEVINFILRLKKCVHNPDIPSKS
jgi:hypothetical protein